MRKTFPILISLALASSACTQANAVTPEAGNDIDCSVLVFYFNSEAKRSDAPQDQQRALAALQSWYAKRVQVLAAEQGAATVQERASPLLAALQRDPARMKEAAASCTERAVRDG